MFHKDSKSRRHRRVVTEAGVPVVEQPVRLGRLRYALLGRPQPDSWGADRSSPAGVDVVARMPFGMRMPQAPVRPVSVRQRVQDGFAAVGRQMDEFVKVMSGGWRKLAAENDRRMESLDVRLAMLATCVHAWAAEADGRDLAAAYAEGATEQVAKLTPQVLAEMDRRAKEMAS